MIISRRNFLILSGAAALTPVLASCGSGSGGGLQYWGAFQDQQQQDYFKKERVDAFRGSAQVRMTVKPNDTIDQLTQTALAAGTGPDLVLTPGPAQVAAYAGAGYLLPLEQYSQKYGWDSALASWALEASRVDGKLVCLPAGYETMMLIYNPATLEQHGWKVPTNRTEFEAICTEAKAKGLMPVAAGNADWRAASEWWVTFALNHYAGPDAVYSALQGQTPWTDPVFADAINLLSGYYQRGWWGGAVDSYFTNTFPNLYAALASGDAVFMITGSWATSEILPYFGAPAGNDATWDWAPLFPLRDGVPAEVWDLGIGQTLSINAKSANPDAAAEYLNFLETDPKRQAQGIAEASLQPAPVHLSEADFPASVDERLVRLYTKLSNAATIGYTTWTFWPQQTDTDLYTNFDKVITGQLSTQDYLAGLDGVFRNELAARKVPPAPTPTGLAR
ncbi:extracellular solute-binding protein [Pseudonocardia aurantiaca]|uniref:ABC transporter substrate-binding protein n=1 Tax=Pseudonocardia aurantiaca TaxID=75290 RepID=A0ABW4FM67_9PSEU